MNHLYNILGRNIYSIYVAGENHKLSMYTDDIFTYLSEPEQSFEGLMNIIEEYGDISWYTLM